MEAVAVNFTDLRKNPDVLSLDPGVKMFKNLHIFSTREQEACHGRLDMMTRSKGEPHTSCISWRCQCDKRGRRRQGEKMCEWEGTGRRKRTEMN